jgi:hypothetical protein
VAGCRGGYTERTGDPGRPYVYLTTGWTECKVECSSSLCGDRPRAMAGGWGWGDGQAVQPGGIGRGGGGACP